MHVLRCGRLDEHAKQRGVGVRQEHGFDPRVRGEALEERARAAVCPRELRVRREVRPERSELVHVRRRRAVADEDRLRLLRAVSAARCDAALTAEVLGRRRRGGCGGGRWEGGEGVVDELAEQTWVDARADYRDVFLRERGVREGARVFWGEVRVRRGKEGCPETGAECEGVCEIERRDRWVVRRLCSLRVQRR